MKKLYFSIFIFVFFSCEHKEEYKASITVINNTISNVTDFTIKSTGDYPDIVLQELAPNGVQNIDVKWIGQQSFFAGTIEYSNIWLTIKYTIGNKKYDIADEKDVKVNSNGNYYSEKTVSNGSKATITINNNGYEIIHQN